MRFDLSDLRLFLAVVDAGSITHGAASANLSLGAASERLRNMELVSGVPLLWRNSRGVVPTRAGDALAHHARLVMRQVSAMHAELSEHASGFRGSVRVLANSAAIAGLLPERIGSFLARNPGIDIDLAERPSSEIVKAIAGGLAEIGVVSETADVSSVAALPFAVDRLVVVVAHGHRLAGNRRVSFAQIAAESVVAFDGALQIHLREQAERAGLRLQPRIQMRTFEGICQLASVGAGIGIVPEVVAKRVRRAFPLASLHLTDAWATRRLFLCSIERCRLEPIAETLLHHLSSGDDQGWSCKR